MKTLYVTLSFVLTCFSSFSQEYQPLLNENTYWDIGAYSKGHICDYHQDLNPERYFISGETIFNDVTYKTFSSFQIKPVNQQQPICPPFYVDTVAYLTNLYLREDLNGQKIYRYDIEKEEEQLLYDFSLTVGEDIYCYQNEETKTITSIENVVTDDGVTRRKFILNDSDVDYYVEGIGGPQGFFNDPVGIFEYGYFNMCIKSKNNDVILRERDCANFTSIYILENNTNTFKIHANTVSDNLQITANLNQTIKLVNTGGMVVKNIHLQKGINTVFVNDLASGIYVLQGENISESYKIVKL